MTERTETTTKTYITCDGCGYTIDPKGRAYSILTVREPGEDAKDLHFHSPRSIGDCLEYWLMNRKAREGKK